MRAVLPSLVGLVLSGVSGFGWEPGNTNATTSFLVDTGRRNAVVSFWHSIYGDSEGYADRMGWTGNYSTCNAGTTAREFQDDVQRRINFVRALAGLHGSALVNDGTTVNVDGHYNPPPSTLRSTAAQQAAHMMARTRVVSHTPSTSLSCFTPAAGNGCSRSSLAYGFYGPGAIDEYMRETSALGDTIWSEAAGHRRWILYPGATVFATGDTPGAPGTPGTAATNVLYCVPTEEELIPTTAGFTAWPSPGYFPDTLNTRLWSLSYPDADFSSASVSMSGPGGAISVTIIDDDDLNYGDPAIVWEVPAGVGASSVAADTTYQVVVTGIQGAGVPASHSYEVIVMDPESLNEPMQLIGAVAPPVGGARYAFQQVDFADGHEVDISQLAAAGWTEGAEDSPAARVIDGTSAGYALRSAVTSGYYGDFWSTGSKAFRLAFDANVNPPVEDHFELDMELVTGSSAQLRFDYRRGYMTRGTTMQVETSVDGGLSWQTAGTSVSGKIGGAPDGGFTGKTVALPANQQAVLVRFRHVWNGGAFYSVQQAPTHPVGIFIDDVTVSGAQELQPVSTVSLGGDASSFRFDSAGIGETLVAGAQYRMRLRAVMDNHEFPFGPTLEVTVTGSPLTGFEAWKAYEQPLLTGGFDDDDDGDGLGNGFEYAFGEDPLDPSTSSAAGAPDLQGGVLRLRKPVAELRSDVLYAAEWSPDMLTWSTGGVTVSYGEGELEAEVAMGGAMRFLRWRISRL